MVHFIYRLNIFGNKAAREKMGRGSDLVALVVLADLVDVPVDLADAVFKVN